MESDNTEDISQPQVVGNKGKYAPNTYELALNSRVNQVAAPKDLTELSEADLDSILSAPLTGEEVALKINHLRENGVALTPDNISFDEHNAYRDWMDKQHFNFMGAVADGFGQATKDVVGGVWDAATDWKKLALGTGLSIATANPVVGYGVAYGASLLEGFARGTRDLGGLAVMAANHPDSPLYRLIINPTGDKRQLYQDFFDLAAWNDQSERIISGQSNLLMPERATYEKLLGRAMGGQIDDFIGVNKGLATASSYILDPTLYFSLGASSATKATAKVATSAGVAALKAGHAGQALAHGVAARATQTTWKASVLNSAGDVMRKTSDAVTKPLEKVYAKIEAMASDVLGTKVSTDIKGGVRQVRSKVGKSPESFNSAVLGAAGVYSLFSIPYGAAITGIYAGAKALGFAGDIFSAIGKNVDNLGFVGSAELLAKQAKAGGRPVAGAIGNAIVGSSVIGEYMKDLGTVMVKGSLYGGAIGYVAGGKEGAAGGIGTGLFLGAAGHNIALAHGTISGKFAKANMVNEFKNHTTYLKEQGHVLKAANMEKLIDMINEDHGENEAVRRLGQLMMAEKSKNLVLSILSTEDMVGALQSDPNFVRTENGVKVLTDLGKVLQDQINSATTPSGKIVVDEKTGKPILGSNAWNGAFVTLDANGKAIEGPVMSWKDKNSGKHHILINMDAIRMERNADGTLVKKKKIIKPALYQTVEGERPATAQTAPAKIASTDTTNGIGDYGVPMKKGSRASRRVVQPKGEKVTPMEGPMPSVERLVSPEQSIEYIPAKTAPSAIISEMFHQMNTVRRKAEIGTEVNSVVRNWLLGDEHKEGWAFRDRKGAVQFMSELYDKMGGGNRGNEGADWKLAISEYETTGVMKPETLEKFQGFIEELGDAMFIGWESGKPFDFVAKGGDIGMGRIIFESVKDVFANHALREATSMGADVRTKQSFAEWFTKTKAGGRFKFDPAIEKSFTDLIRIYNEKGMKNNGRTQVNVSKLSSAELLSHAQAYGYEERLKKKSDGTYRLMSREEYNKERHELATVGMRQLAEAIELDPSVAEGIDFYITEDKGDTAGFDAAVKEQSTAEQESIDTIGRTKGFLYQSPDFSDIGVGLDDITKAGIVTAKKNNTWKQAKDAYGRPVNYGTGSRGRPRTAPSGKLGYEMKKAFEEGKTIVMRGIPNGKAFAIIERFITKQQRRNMALLAPIVADGGQTKANVVRGDYWGIEQVQPDSGITLSRAKEDPDVFDARTVNFVPYNFELRLTLRNPKTPTVNYKSPHFTFNAKGYDIDSLTRRGQILWQENAEIRDQYVHLNEFMSHIYKTIDDYSVSNAIPATHFFGDDEGARTRRRYVVAAIGAVPTVELKGNADKGIVGIFSTYEADWHDSQMRNVLGKINHPWMDVKLDLLSNPILREGEGSQVRMNEKVYRRGQIPTPKEGTTDLYTDANGRGMMYQSADRGVVEMAKVKKVLSGNRDIVNPENLMSYQGRARAYTGNRTYTPDQLSNGFIGRIHFENKDYYEKQGLTLEHQLKDVKTGNGKTAKELTLVVKKREGIGGNFENKIVGTYNAVWFDNATRIKQSRGGYMKVVPEYEGKGIGTLLQSEMAERLRFYGATENSAQIADKKLRPIAIRDKVFGNTEIIDRNTDPIVRNKIEQGRFYQSADSAIDVDMENPASFYQNTKGLPLDVQKLVADSNDPSKLARELGKMDMFKPLKRVALYQAADEIGASNAKEKSFLKSNYADAVEKGDIFLAESVKRFVRSTGENPVVVKHTIEEHLASGGSSETYVSAFESNKPTVVVAVNGTTNRFVLLSKQYGKDVGSVASLKGGKAQLFFGFTSDSYSQSITPAESPTMRAAMVMRESVGQTRSLLSFKNPLVLHNWELKTKGAEKGAASSVSIQNLDFETIGNVAQSAKDLGHDGLILTDSVVGKIDGGNAMFIPLESDRQIAVIDTTLDMKPVPRNSGYKEGGQYMRQAADQIEPLPEGAFGRNNPDTVKISRGFKSSKGITVGDGKFIVKLNPDKSFKIGYEYEKMLHNPNNPLVKKAYEQFIKETIEQMHELQSQGYTAELNTTSENPYPNSQAVIASIRDKKHLKVFSTDAGFGTNEDGTPKTITDADVKGNPLLAMSEFKDSNGMPMRINDVFRFVHDFFGHSERGNSFGPLGEENAWDVHSRMYSPLARRAMTTETRGQNSWVNFLNEDNKKTNAVRAEARRLRKIGKADEADVLVNSVKDKDVYAPQKIGLLPEWASKIDEEMSPIETEMFGRHQTSEGKYGMYQAADNVNDGVHPELQYTGMTKQTSGDIEYADAHLRYADFYREQLKKRENGEIANDVALRMILNTWIKNNINKKWDLRDTADILSKLPIGDSKFINVFEYTKEHRDSQVASLIRKDKNYIKDSKAESVVAERAETVALIKEELQAEIASLDDPEQIVSRKKAAVKAILKAHAKKTLDWMDKLPAERKNKEARRVLQTLGVEPRKAESWDDANKDSVARVKKEKEIEKIISRLNRENMDEINAGREAIYEDKDIRSAAEMEWETEKVKIEEDVSKMSPEDKEAYLAAQEEALQSGELSQEDYELQAQQRGGEGTKEPVSRKRAMINPPKSLEEHIVELGMEAEKARANGDEFALTEDEVIQMATRFHEMEVQAWEIWNRPEKRAGINYGTIEAKGPVPTLVDVQKKYLNTEYFNNSGSSLMWKVGDKIYKGTEAEASKQARKDGIKTGGLEAVYPEEMQAIIDDINEKLKNIKAEDYNAVGIGTVLSLFQLWGFEVNKNLADKFFEPIEENINTVGMNESQAKKYRAEVRGKLIVRMTEEARLTQAIDAVPKFLDDVQSILTMAIGNMTDGVAETEIRAASGQDLGSKLASIIKIDTNLKKEWIAEFARKNPDLMEVVFYRTKEEFVRDRMNNIDFKVLPLELKAIIEPLLDTGITPAQIKELIKAHLETSWEGQGKHPINQFFKPEGKNSEAFSIEKNIGKILRENNETLKRARSGVEVQKDAQGNVISYSNGLITEEQIAQQSRQEAYNARRSFIEFMFSKANDLILTESAKEEARPLTPAEIQEARRLEQKASQTQYDQPIGPKFEEVKPKEEKPEIPAASVPSTQQDETSAYARINKTLADISEDEPDYMRGVESIQMEPVTKKPSKPKATTTVEPPKAVADYKKPIGPEQPKPVKNPPQKLRTTHKHRALTVIKNGGYMPKPLSDNVKKGIYSEGDGKWGFVKWLEKHAFLKDLSNAEIKNIAESLLSMEEYARSRNLTNNELLKQAGSEWEISESVAAYEMLDANKVESNLKQDKQIALDGNSFTWGMPEYNELVARLKKKGIIKPEVVKAEKIEKKTNAQANAVQTIKATQVSKPEVVGVKHAEVIKTGTVAAGSPEVAQAVSQVLQIKDDFTLNPASSHDTKGAWYSANKRYIAEPTRGNKGYRVTMLDHISPYDDKGLPKTMIGIVSSLEQAQLAIREHAFYQRRLFEMNNEKFSSGQGVGDKLQSQAPVLTPQQTQQIAQQVAQTADQNPAPPVVNPQVKAETHPRYNDIVRGLKGLGIPDAVLKDLTKKAIDNLGTNADIREVIIAVLSLSQGRALQVAQSNQTHTATAGAYSEPVTLQTASQVVIMPTDAGTIAATGSVIPQLPIHFLVDATKTPEELAAIRQAQYDNKVKGIGLNPAFLSGAGDDKVTGRIKSRHPNADASTLATIKALTTFNGYNSVYSLPNGQPVNGKSYKNSLGYVIQQSGIGKWRLYNPAAAIVSVTDNEQEAVDKLIKNYFGK